MKITLELTRSQLCDLALACTCAQFSAGDGGKKMESATRLSKSRKRSTRQRKQRG